jgi:predicted nucleic acid-binding protein
VIVVDASVAAKWLLSEANSDKAEALYVDCVGRSEPIAAPHLLPFEIANILRQQMRRAGMSLSEAQQLMARFQTFMVILDSPPGMFGRALVLADAYGLPAAYDAYYLALAEHHRCTLWTADLRLLRLVSGTLTYVSPIANY